MSQPTTRQDMKADARQSAANAPAADPEIAAQALADAKSRKTDSATGKPRQQPVYKTQGKTIAGENVHRDTDAVISEFDDPAANTV